MKNFVEFKKVSRIYKSDDGNITAALKNVSLKLPTAGLVAIVGKSGSGKSTFINLLGLLDKPTSGNIFIKNENIKYWKKKRIQCFHNQDIGIVFQHYYLLEDQTVKFNILLPLLIANRRLDNEYNELLNLAAIPQHLSTKLCKDLSGGEKERIAILRAVINQPKILLCDEPTGALDYHNSVLVMELLKRLSKDCLVILVSHNYLLTEKYADRLITIKDGEVSSDINLNEIQENPSAIKRNNKKRKSFWQRGIIFSNFRKHLIRNVISIISLSFGLISSLLIIGFNHGSDKSIIDASYKQLNYGVATISKEHSQYIEGSKASIVQQSRPSLEEIDDLSFLKKYEIEYNFSSLLPVNCYVSIGENKLDDFTYNPIYSYQNNYIDKNLAKMGYISTNDCLENVVINEKAYDYFIKKLSMNPIGLNVDISYTKEFHFYTGNNTNPTINDVFTFKKTVTITGVVEEMDFLSTPKIYYSYKALLDYLYDYPLINLSNYFNRTISWYERVATAGNSEEISSYSYYLFLKNIKDKQIIEIDSSIDNKDIVFSSTPYILSKTLLDLVNAASIGMGLFLVIALVGTALIMGIISFSSYSDDHKKIAILTCLGASRKNITSIYVIENILIAICSLIISFVLAPLSSLLINKIIYANAGFEAMISIPLSSLFNIPLLFPLILIVSSLGIAFFSTIFPIIFSSKISLKQELSDE